MSCCGGRSSDAVPTRSPRFPWETVLDRLLSAPDQSVLVVRHRGESLGLLSWRPSVTETSLHPEVEAEPEGMVTATGYNLEVDLNPDRRKPFGPLARGDPRRTRHQPRLAGNWRLPVFQRPSNWEITAHNGDERIRIRFEEGRNS